ncbi:MAG: hypothetical protein Tsb0013_18100 [Phycisphaerales bacterium]
MSELFAKLDRAQHRRGYKLGASVVVSALLIALLATLYVVANRPDAEIGRAERLAETPTGLIDLGPLGALRGGFDLLLAQLATTEGLVTVVVAGGLVLAGALAVVWLGLSLTYLAALVIGWAVAWPLMVIDATRDFGLMLFGAVPLVLVLMTLLQLARLALSGPSPTLAIAKNVLSEAVRMKISLVFIVILLLLLSVTPTVLTEDQALRYRVQQWLTYGLGLPFGVLALLTVFFSAASVAFEQRDKIIWQTMTKPVRPHQYLLGKWAGIMTLNLILLTVSATGVFLFTEYLRYQPAENERSYKTDTLGNRTGPESQYPHSEDRRILETQVLAARVAVEPVTPDATQRTAGFFADLQIATDPELDRSDRSRIISELLSARTEQIEAIVERRIETLRTQADSFVAGDEDISAQRARITREVLDELSIAQRSIPPGSYREFYFDLRDQWDRFSRVYEGGLETIDREVQRLVDAGQVEDTDTARANAFLEVQDGLREQGLLPEMPMLTLRYTVDAGTNDPTQIYDVFFQLNGEPWPPPERAGLPMGLRRVGLGHRTNFDFPVRMLDNPDDELDGVLIVRVGNSASNPRTMTFAKGNLEVLYDAGGYQLNFLRTIATMWMKLAFIAAVGVSLSSFLSFPVAALVTLAVLFAGEGADYLSESLETYITKDQQGNINYIRIPIRGVSLLVAWVFETYGSLKPAEDIADGKLMEWSTLGRAALWIGVWSGVMLSLGWAAFRRKELAIYSGH